MITVTRTSVLVALLTLTALLATACNVDVHKGDRNDRSNVDIRTPIGGLSVQANNDTEDTGLPVYPDAKPLQDDSDHPKNANVDIAMPFFGMKVSAARFESDGDPEAIASFYRDKMAIYGEVVDCHGNIDFRGAAPHCTEKSSNHEIQLMVGTEKRHRLVVVKPRGSGSELGLIRIEVRDGGE